MLPERQRLGELSERSPLLPKEREFLYRLSCAGCVWISGRINDISLHFDNQSIYSIVELLETGYSRVIRVKL